MSPPVKKRLSPARAVRRLCLDCMGGSSPNVKDCTTERCPLFKNREVHGERITLRLMRLYCLHCNGWPID